MRWGSRLLCGWNLICCRLLIIETWFHWEAWTIALATLPPSLPACRTTCVIVEPVWRLDDVGECCRVLLFHKHSWFGRPEHGDTCESSPPNLLISWLLIQPLIWQEDQSNELRKTKSISNCEELTHTESLGNPLHVFHFRALRYSHLN